MINFLLKFVFKPILRLPVALIMLLIVLLDVLMRTGLYKNHIRYGRARDILDGSTIEHSKINANKIANKILEINKPALFISNMPGNLKMLISAIIYYAIYTQL